MPVFTHVRLLVDWFVGRIKQKLQRMEDRSQLRSFGAANRTNPGFLLPLSLTWQFRVFFHIIVNFSGNYAWILMNLLRLGCWYLLVSTVWCGKGDCWALEQACTRQSAIQVCIVD